MLGTVLETNLLLHFVSVLQMRSLRSPRRVTRTVLLEWYKQQSPPSAQGSFLPSAPALLLLPALSAWSCFFPFSLRECPLFFIKETLGTSTSFSLLIGSQVQRVKLITCLRSSHTLLLVRGKPFLVLLFVPFTPPFTPQSGSHPSSTSSSPQTCLVYVFKHACALGKCTMLFSVCTFLIYINAINVVSYLFHSTLF